ncbi:hypothetical protein [Actinomyces israelii]|uniref:hypothetical protein n=1 Tax=Actinomyces israelii TaxID=1659 RepID=UPI002354EFE9|nr:hypothetical protein [Actinomyces israelii]
MLAYRSTFSVGGAFEQVEPAVRRVMVDWAERKHRKELGPDGLGALGPGGYLQPHPRLELLLVDSREQSEDQIFGFVVVERDGEDTWTSQVMAASGPRLASRSLISVEIDSPVSPDDPLRPRSAGVPRFVRSMLRRLDCDDHGIHLTNDPKILRPQDVPRLRKELGEEDHHGLVLVAGTAPGLPLEQWTDFIGGITRDTAGQAATYVLDEEATAAFNDSVSAEHAVVGGSLRTFVPGARFDDVADGVRHRFLTAETLADDRLRERAGRVLRRRSRAFTNARPPDRRTRRYLRLLGRHLDAIALRAPERGGAALAAPTAAQPAVAVPADATGLHARVEEPTSLLAARSEDLDGAKAELAEARDTITLLEQRDSKREHDDDALREELQRRTEERDELGLDYAVALDDKDRALSRAERSEREVQRLRTALSCAGRGEEAWAVPGEGADLAQPSGWPELATWAANGELARALPWVELTCDWDRALDLDDQNNLSWIAKTWDILRTLNDYGRARADGSATVRNLHEYLDSPPDGFRTVSRGRYRPTESKTVANRPRYRKERMFPAPEQVPGRDGDGRVYMDKHFVIASAGMVSPRLYLYDATDTPGYGKVVVGYIGRHLTNNQTN